DTIYSRDSRGVYVNLFIPSEVRCADHGVTIRQETGFPDDPVVRLTVTSGFAPMVLRVRVPSWTAGPPEVVLNGTPVRGTVSGSWITILRRWAQGDKLEVTYGPVALAGGGVGAAYAAPDAAVDTGNDVALLDIVKHPEVKVAAPQSPPLPLLDTSSVRRTAAQPMTFAATADGHPVTLMPVARAQHEPFTVYWRTSPGAGARSG